MSEVLDRFRRQQQPINPFAAPAVPQRGGFVESMISSLPELFGANPSEAALAFRAANPISGLVSQVLPTIVPYGGMFALSRTAAGASALAKGMKGAKAIGTSLGMNTTGRPIIAGAVREMLRYSPLEIGRLGVGATLYPENTGELFADVAISMALEGTLGAGGAFLRTAGKAKAANAGPRVPSQLNMTAHPVLDLRALRQPEAQAQFTPEQIDAEAQLITAQVLNDQLPKSYLSKVRIPLFGSLENADSNTSLFTEALFRPNSREVKNRGLDRRKMWEGPTDDNRTVDPGQLQTIVQEAGFASPRELAENAMQARFVTVMDDRTAGRLNQLIESPAYNKFGDDAFAARTEFGSSVVLKRLPRVEPEMPAPQLGQIELDLAAPKPPPREDAIFKAGDRLLVAHTDRPGAFAPEMARLNAAADDVYAAMARVFQPMRHQPNPYNDAMDTLVRVFTPDNVSFMQNNLKRTAVAAVTKNIIDRGVKVAGLEDSVALRDYVDKAYDVFVPSMFKERRNTEFARHSALVQQVFRTADTAADEATFGRLERAAGAHTSLNRGFERRGVSGLTINEAIEELSDEGFNAAVKIVNAPVNSLAELRKVADEGEIGERDLALIQRIMDARSEFDHRYIIQPIEQLKTEHNYNFMEGYIAPRTPLGEWGVKVHTEGRDDLVYWATGKNPQQAQAIAQAVVDEAASRGTKLAFDKATTRHTIELANGELEDIMKKVGEQYAKAPTDFDEVISSAMKRVRFIGAKGKSGGGLGAPRAPGSLANERTGIKMNTVEYSRRDLVQAIHADMQRKARFAGAMVYTDRWGHQLASNLRPQNMVLFQDVKRRISQGLGIEGQVTRFINSKLAKIPGLGGRAGTKIAAGINKTLFAFQLGILNPTYALLNALSPLQTVLPQLAFVLRAPQETVANFFQYMPIKNSAGKTVAIGGALDPIKVMWQATKMIEKLDEEAADVMLRLRRQGVINPMIYEEQAIKIPQSLKESFQKGGWAEFSYEAMTSMARNSESFARIVSANAGYIVGKQFLGLADDQLVHFTRKFVESTNYLYGQSDRARIITGPIGSMFGLFKNWQMHFMGMTAMYAGVLGKSGTFAPLMYQTGAALTLGGLGATPLVHIANGLANFHEDKPGSFLWMQENWGDPLADMAYFGPMGGIGLTLQASSTIPGTDVRNDLQMIHNSIVFERAAQLGGVVGDGIAHYRATGENPLTDPNIRDRLLAAGAPRAVSRAASVVEGNYVTSMGTGYPMMREPSFTARVMHGMGVNTVEIEQHQIAGRNLWKQQEARKNAVTAHGQQMAQALQASDWEQLRRIEISAMAQELPMSSVYKSAKGFERREEGDLLSRYNKGLAGRYRTVFEE